MTKSNLVIGYFLLLFNIHFIFYISRNIFQRFASVFLALQESCQAYLVGLFDMLLEE